MQTLSNLDVPANRRLSYLHDFVATQIAALRFAPHDEAMFHYSLASQTLGGDTVLGIVSYSAVTGRRDRGLTGDGRSNYLMSIHDTAYELEAGGRTHTIAAGRIVMVNEASPFAFRLPGTRATILSLNREKLQRLAPRLDEDAFHSLDPAGPDGELLSGYLSLLSRHAPSGDTRAIADHIYQLVARVLVREAYAGPSCRAAIGLARLRLVKADIARHLTDPGLGVDAVARRQKISPRYVQQLFAREGATFSEYLKLRRLDLAKDQLADPNLTTRPISAIAFDAGFGDLSTFNRAFRERFGCAPRDVRAVAMRAS